MYFTASTDIQVIKNKAPYCVLTFTCPRHSTYNE